MLWQNSLIKKYVLGENPNERNYDRDKNNGPFVPARLQRHYAIKVVLVIPCCTCSSVLFSKSLKMCLNDSTFVARR